MTATEIDLTPFCQPKDAVSRRNCFQPWTADGWTYATNGAIVIRVPARDLPKPEGRQPDQKRLNWNADGDWKPLPAMESLPASSTCEKCEGTGKLQPPVRCNHCGEDVDCPDCVAGTLCRKIEKSFWSAKYLQLIHALGPVEYLIANCMKKPSVGSDVLHFRFEGGRGMLMAMQVREA